MAQSPSLWQRRDHRANSLIADVKARQPGDLLSVLINEQSDIENRDKRTMRKNASSSADVSGNYGVGTASGSLTGDYDTAAQRAMNGDSQFRSEREYLDKFTVMVVDTLPNGNLIIGGTRNVNLEGDNRTLVLTGIVRRADVKADNTISSPWSTTSACVTNRTQTRAQTESSSIRAGWGKK